MRCLFDDASDMLVPPSRTAASPPRLSIQGSRDTAERSPMLAQLPDFRQDGILFWVHFQMLAVRRAAGTRVVVARLFPKQTAESKPQEAGIYRLTK
jgi:hypothetical protein